MTITVELTEAQSAMLALVSWEDKTSPAELVAEAVDHWVVDRLYKMANLEAAVDLETVMLRTAAEYVESMPGWKVEAMRRHLLEMGMDDVAGKI